MYYKINVDTKSSIQILLVSIISTDDVEVHTLHILVSDLNSINNQIQTNKFIFPLFGSYPQGSANPV